MNNKIHKLEARTTYNKKHNPLMTTLYGYIDGKKPQVIFGCSGWKNLDDMVKHAINMNLIKPI